MGGVVSTWKAMDTTHAPPSGGTAQANTGIRIKGIPRAHRQTRSVRYGRPPRAGSVVALVHQVCDLVEIRTSQAAGTTIQLHMSLRG